MEDIRLDLVTEGCELIHQCIFNKTWARGFQQEKPSKFRHNTIRTPRPRGWLDVLIGPIVKSPEKELKKMAEAITFITGLIEAFFDNKGADQGIRNDNTSLRVRGSARQSTSYAILF